MQIFWTLFIAVCANAASFANATSFQLVGRGVMDRKTQEVIAVACVDERAATEGFDIGECKKIQHLYIDAHGAGSLIGSVYSLGEEGLKAKLKEIHRGFLMAKQEKARVSKYGVSMLGVGTVYFGSAILFDAIMLPFWLSPPGIVLLLAVTGVEYYFANYDGFKFKGKHESKVYLDQDQWNWSVSPKKTMHHKFRQYFNFIKTGNPGKVFVG